MFKFLFLILILIQSSCFIKCTEFQERFEVEEIKLLSKSIVRIDITNAVYKDKKIDFKSYSGTGVVLDSRQNGSLILTVSHLCALTESLVSHVMVLNNENQSTNGTPVYQNVTNDLCIMKTEKPIGLPIKFAKIMPPLWAKVIYLGAPVGMFGNGLSYVGEGRYFGLKENDKITSGYASVPSTMGASGSGLFYKGKLIGIINEVQSLKFDHGTMFVPLNTINKFLIKATK